MYQETGYVDNGKIYTRRQRGGGVLLMFTLITVFVLGIFVAPRLPEWFWGIVYPESGARPLPTAVVTFSQPGMTAPRPVIDRTRGDSPVTSQEGSTGVEPPQVEPTAPPVPPVEQPIVAAPPPDATPLPEPGQEGFEASFQASTCSAMITYLRGHACYGRVNQAPQPQPGSDEFVESFE